jgi:hypothetical protein
MLYQTKEELDRSYWEMDRRRKIPEGLSPAARRLYDKDLAALEGRDGFEITVSVPHWLPVSKWAEYHSRIQAAIDTAAAPIIQEANLLYKLGDKAFTFESKVAMVVREPVKEPEGILIMDHSEIVEVWTSFNLDGELLGSHFEPS